MNAALNRTRATFFLLAVLCGAVALAGCEDTGLRPFKDNDDAGGALDRSYTYTPEACGYEVRTPTVKEAGPHADEAGEGSFVDHVHVSFAGPASSTFAVNWRSNEDNRASQVLYGTDREAVEAAKGPTDAVKLQGGHHMLYQDVVDEETRIHETHVCGLEPNTNYFYKVGGAGVWSEVFSTSTGPETGSSSPIRLAVFGDSRNPKGKAWTNVVKAAVDAQADLALFSGDAVFFGTQQALWDQFFEAKDGDFSVQNALASLPMMVTNGNHDALSVNFIAQFAMPQAQSDGERAEGEEWYSFDYGNVHVAVLNDTVLDESVLGGSESQWLAADLAAVDRTKTPWVFVVHHRPFYTCQSNHRPDASLRQSWQPIFDQHHVDLVFTGHNHVYERSVPIRGLMGGEGMAASSEANGIPVIDGQGLPSGTIYLVSAGAGAELYGVSTECGLTQAALSAHNYLRVDVDGLDITVAAINTDTGATIDTFTYSKE